jgi:mannosyltransferase OCH1-like enzyme
MRFSLLLLAALIFPNYDFGREIIPVDFHQSMKSCDVHDISFAQKDRNWQIAELLYNRFIVQDLQFSPEPLIPLIVHHIWLGSKVPDYARKFRRTWIEYNPSWTFILWTDHPEKEFGKVVLRSFDALKAYLLQPDHDRFIVMDMRYLVLRNREAFTKRAQNYGEKSDIARYEVLNEIGGLYVDTDFECLRSFADFHHCCDFYTSASHTKEFYLYNGLIGSKPQHVILEDAILSLAHRIHRGDSLWYSGPYYFTQCFIRQVVKYDGRAVAFPVTFFYPWPHFNRRESYDEARRWILPESYALHYWKVSWAR